jgi:hypothetical protein
MKQGIQTFLAEAGEAACYALDIIQIASEESKKILDPISMLEIGIHIGMIHYGTPDDNDNFFVKDPALFLTTISGDEWTVTKESADYIAQPGERVVERWERKVTGSTIGHFRLPEWDSLVDSKTVKYGQLVSKRVFRRVK